MSEQVKNLDCNLIRKETDRDLILSQVKRYVLEGWPESVDTNDYLKPFKIRQNELTIEQYSYVGPQSNVPKTLQKEMLNELHSTHLGIVKMKTLARTYFWWPALDKDIENIGKSCKLCLENSNNSVKGKLHVWKWPENPNYRIHADFCGPIDGYMYLVIVEILTQNG